MTKAPIQAEMSKGPSDNTNNATKKFEYTTVADRLRAVSWNNYGHPNGEVNWFTGPNLPLPATAVLSKGHPFNSVLRFLVRYGSIKCEKSKIERNDDSYMIKI